MKQILLILLSLTVGTAFADIRYNDVQQKSSHNSFSRDEGLLDQLVFHRIRSIEFDLYRGKIGRPSLSNDWYVYHTPVIDTGTSCDKFSHCLQELKVFDQQVPDHEVVTVWFDIKDGFSGGQSPQRFDDLITQYIDESDILTPADLFSSCPGATSLKATVTGTCDWPTLSELKGKWIFVLTNGQYSSNRPNRLGFTAAGISSVSDINNAGRIFFNTDSGDINVTRHAHANNFVSRRYVLNDPSNFNAALDGQVHHLATDKINYVKDSWSRTHNGQGWPFNCIGKTCTGQRESDNIITVDVNSEDIWGRRDHFVFLYQNKGTANGRWISSVNVASSHIDRWAKSCVMARVSLSDNSPYFAVCRAADNNRLFAQYRDGFGNNSGSSNANINDADGLDQENLTYIKMDIYNNGRCALAQGSQDGIRWTSITSRCFNQTLAYQGIAASSHGNQTVKHHFSNLSYWGNGFKEDDFDYKRIGTVRYFSAYDGTYPAPSGRYDLGTSSSPVFSSYQRVSKSTLAIEKGYGWLSANSLGDRDRGSSSQRNDLNRDIVFSAQTNTFEQAVDNGNWYAMITFGDSYPHDAQAVDVEGVRQLSNISTASNQYRNYFVASRVDDNTLSLTFSDEGGADANWAITRIVIQNTPFGGQAALP